MVAYYTDDQGRVRVIPDGDPEKHSQENSIHKDKKGHVTIHSGVSANRIVAGEQPKIGKGANVSKTAWAVASMLARLLTPPAYAEPAPTKPSRTKPIASNPPKKPEIPAAYSHPHRLNIPGLDPIDPANFPKSAELKPNRYPDITNNFNKYVAEVLKNVEPNAPIKAMESFQKKFNNGQHWDIKKQPNLPLPGTWAKYKGELVTDAYLANNLYGQAMAKAGYSLTAALTIGEGISLISRHIEFDQPEDQAAIVSGWYEAHTGDPWPDIILTPTDYDIIKHKYPKHYEDLKKSIYVYRNSKYINKIIKKIWDYQRAHGLPISY